MGFVLLAITGALLGWLTTIARRTESGREIGHNIFWGTAGSLLAGIVAANGMLLGSVAASTLLFGLLGAIIGVALYNIFQHKRPLA